MTPEELRHLAVDMHFRALSERRGIKDSDSYIQRVEKYYDHVTPFVLEELGLTYQLGIRSTDERLNSHFFALRAGIEDGQRVLDAGCGWGGPAVQIAEEYPNLSLVGVTVSGKQTSVMSQEILQRNLGDRVSVVKSDFHHLPFPNEEFDLVYFLESAGHSEFPVRLFEEVLRVLKPGGQLYIKEPFLRTCELRETQCDRVKAMESIFQYKMCSMNELSHWIEEAGFSGVQSEDISTLLSFDHFWSAMRDDQGGLTSFGAEHSFPLSPLDLIMGEVRAQKSL